MDFPSHPSSPDEGRLVSRVGIGVLCLSGLVLTGWALDITVLKSVVPGYVSMKANTAVGFALLALALRLSGRRAAVVWRERIALSCALAAVALGATTLTEYLLKTDLGIDQLLFRDSANAVATSNPGRMSPLTAVDFVLLGAALWLIIRSRAVFVAQVLAALVVLSALSSLVGYVYHTSQFYRLGDYTAMAVHTSSAFLAIGLGTMAVRSDEGLVRFLFRYESGGRLVGWLLVVVVVVPVVLGWLRLQGELAGLYEPNFGVGLMTIALSCTLITVILWLSQRLGRGNEERRRAERALRASEARLNFVLETIHAGGWEVDLKDHKAQCTVEHHRIFGYETYFPDWSYPTFLEHVLAEDRARVDQCFHAATEAQTDLNFECRIRRADNAVRWIWVVGRPQREPAGQLQHMVGTVQDITERKQTEAAVLQAIEQKRIYELLHSIIERLPNYVYLKDKNSRFLMANRGLAQLFGMDSSSELVGLGDHDLFPPEVASVFRADEEAVLAGREVREQEEIVTFPSGLTRTYLTTKIPFRAAQGEIIGILGVGIDITERKQTELLSNRLAAIVEYSDDGIISKDLNGIIVSWNKAAEKLFGYAADEIVGSSILRLIPTDRHAEETSILERLRRGESVEHFETLRQRKDGRLLEVSITVSPIRDAAAKVIGASKVVRDITTRKRAEAERLKLESKLQDTQKLESLGVLAGGIAHDFNNLLTGILGNASLARLEMGETSPVVPNLEQIEQAAQRAAELCRQMLAYAGRGRFVVQRLDLNQVVTDTTRLLDITISKKCVLRFNLAPTLPLIAADATQIRQIIMNLVINASEAIGPRSGVIALSTGVVRVDEDYLATLLHSDKITVGDYVFMEISDNGSGMDADVLGKIFDPFFTTKFTGRGLGLAAVLGIVRGHKGCLKVYSEPGRGTTFKILLPCIEGAVEPSIAGLPNADDLWRGQGTVLVADDEETVRTVSARILEALGFSVVLAADGCEAVEKYRSEPSRYALVLLDLTMPHMDGEETFRQLRHLNPGVKVVLMSGFNQMEAISRFTGKGLAGFVQKPFEINDVVASIRTAFLQS